MTLDELIMRLYRIKYLKKERAGYEVMFSADGEVYDKFKPVIFKDKSVIHLEFSLGGRYDG